MHLICIQKLVHALSPAAMPTVRFRAQLPDVHVQG